MGSISRPNTAVIPPTRYIAKRRKVRKGTFSCWECKRRKMKCLFDPFSSAACKACQRRGSECVGQEFCDLAPSGDNSHETSRSVEEACDLRFGISDCVEEPQGNDGATIDCGSRKRLMNPKPPHDPAFHYYTSVNVALLNPHQNPPVGTGTHVSLSQLLHNSLPSREWIQSICKSGRCPSILTHEVLTIPYNSIQENGLKTLESLIAMPRADVHPVLITQYMLRLALFLQHISPDLHKEIKNLSESPRTVMERIADLALRLVTTNDEFLGSIEGLECVMLEAVYQVNLGNLRLTWLTNRRAMGIAQLMGLHQPDRRPQYKVLEAKAVIRPRIMWFRIVELDRYLSLLLGVPQGCLDHGTAPDVEIVGETPVGRLERSQSFVASRILERGKSPQSHRHFSLTRDIDIELQKAARRLPSKWWLAPDLAEGPTRSQDVFWNTRRLYAQMLHYNLLNQLHLPYMLQSSSAERNYYYSRITCVNASREILSRFIALRGFNRIAYSCRMLDFLALMAALTLLLAHLDGHYSALENLLAHQYLSDRAMVERTLDSMKELNRLNSDALSAQSAEILGQLLALKVETLNTSAGGGIRVSVNEMGNGSMPPEVENEIDIVQMQIPYFGTIKITREYLGKNVPKPLSSTDMEGYQPETVERPSMIDVESRLYHSRLVSGTGDSNAERVKCLENRDEFNLSVPSTPQQVPPTNDKSHMQREHFSISANRATEFTTHIAPQIHNGLCDPIQQQEWWPGLLADTEDWAFQGVDLTFFESLMSSVENEQEDWGCVA